LHSSGRELGLLELQRLLISEWPDRAHADNSYGIFDPPTHSQVGIAREVSGARWRFLQSFLNRTSSPIKLEVCETEDESLVFTVHWTAGWWRRRLEVYDADDSLVGYGEQRFLSGHRSLWLYDRSGLPFVEVQETLRGDCSFMGPGGRKLGVLTCDLSGRGKESQRADYVVSIAEEIADQPFAKMLLLGAALASHIIPHTKAK
jgi:hypothetical protein